MQFIHSLTTHGFPFPELFSCRIDFPSQRRSDFVFPSLINGGEGIQPVAPADHHLLSCVGTVEHRSHLVSKVSYSQGSHRCQFCLVSYQPIKHANLQKKHKTAKQILRFYLVCVEIRTFIGNIDKNNCSAIEYIIISEKNSSLRNNDIFNTIVELYQNTNLYEMFF